MTVRGIASTRTQASHRQSTRDRNHSHDCPPGSNSIGSHAPPLFPRRAESHAGSVRSTGPLESNPAQSALDTLQHRTFPRSRKVRSSIFPYRARLISMWGGDEVLRGSGEEGDVPLLLHVQRNRVLCRARRIATLVSPISWQLRKTEVQAAGEDMARNDGRLLPQQLRGSACAGTSSIVLHQYKMQHAIPTWRRLLIESVIPAGERKSKMNLARRRERSPRLFFTKGTCSTPIARRR